jgi:hypothetical protein
MKRTVQMVLRLIAAGLILIGGLNAAVEFARRWRLHDTLDPWTCLLWAMPVVLGLALFVKAAALARRLTDDLDDE